MVCHKEATYEDTCILHPFGYVESSTVYTEKENCSKCSTWLCNFAA
uniref:Uncharacterized protein n=1 Tax=Arundo donax TaxID=35708 RepID=A0A0A8Z748_ARUDO